MKKFTFNHNDYVTVTLTKEGAEHLSKLRKEFYDAYPVARIHNGRYPPPKTSFKEGEVYRDQFWRLINDFHEMMHLGMASPFEMGKIEVDSSLKQD